MWSRSPTSRPGSHSFPSQGTSVSWTCWRSTWRTCRTSRTRPRPLLLGSVSPYRQTYSSDSQSRFIQTTTYLSTVKISVYILSLYVNSIKIHPVPSVSDSHPTIRAIISDQQQQLDPIRSIYNFQLFPNSARQAELGSPLPVDLTPDRLSFTPSQ